MCYVGYYDQDCDYLMNRLFLGFLEDCFLFLDRNPELTICPQRIDTGINVIFFNPESPSSFSEMLCMNQE